jgi:ABC-type phosphate/phosphonate transport system substrate-binding protein
VLDGYADVGSTYCTLGPRGELIGSAWAQLFPARARELRVLESSGPIPSDLVVAHKKTPPAVAAAVASALLRMHEDPEGRALLESFFTAERMVRANPADDLEVLVRSGLRLSEQPGANDEASYRLAIVAGAAETRDEAVTRCRERARALPFRLRP